MIKFFFPPWTIFSSVVANKIWIHNTKMRPTKNFTQWCEKCKNWLHNIPFITQIYRWLCHRFVLLVLYSYYAFLIWREWRDSNPRPLPWQGSVLTKLNYTPIVRILIFISTHVRPSKNQPKLARNQRSTVKEKKVYLSVYQDSCEQ